MNCNAISVVIPTYKSSPFIRETLESVFAQTRLPDEVIVVDDCSPDDTVAVVEEIAATAPVPLRVIRQPQNFGGPARPLNVGIEAARGEVIATLDHDDHWLPDYIKLHTDCRECIPQVGLTFGVPAPFAQESAESRRQHALRAILNLATKFKDPFYLLRSQAAFELLVPHQCYAHSCSNMVFAKRSWKECGSFDERIRTTGDFSFLHRLVARSDIGFIAEVVLKWTSREESLYVSSASRQVERDTLRVLWEFDQSRLSVTSRDALRQQISALELSLAFMERNEGNYGTAFRFYARNLRRRSSWMKAAAGLVKLLPHRFFRSRLAAPLRPESGA